MLTRSSGSSTKEGDEMAEKRMFSKDITDGDEFTSMPPTAQCFYFHLCMSADDDGFSNRIRDSMFKAHASTDDFDTLVRKRFIIPFDSGVIVIKHWKLHNYIRNDRYHETKYLEEKAQLVLKNNGVYTEANNFNDSVLDTVGIPGGRQVVYQMDTENRLDKNSIEERSVDKDSIVEGRINKNIRSSQNKDFKEGNTYSSCSEPFCENSELEADVELIPLNDGSGWRPSVSLYDEYCKLYPNVDINAAFKRIRAWCISNPTKCKTRRGVKRFINSWLSREQDAGPKRSSSGKTLAERIFES